MKRACLTLTLLFALTNHAVAHQGHSQRAPWDACQERALSQVCSWTDSAHNLHEGTCRHMRGDLICVRHKPIRPANAPPRPWTWWTLLLVPGALVLARTLARRETAP